MYKYSAVRLIIGEIDTSIPFKVGVQQGDNMEPVLFLFFVIAFAETLEKEWIKHDLHKLQFRRHDNSPRSAVIISSRPRRSFSEGNISKMFCLLYVDDGEFAFSSSIELEIGSAIIQAQFSKFGV